MRSLSVDTKKAFHKIQHPLMIKKKNKNKTLSNEENLSNLIKEITKKISKLTSHIMVKE